MLHPEKIEEKTPHFAKFLELIHSPEDWKIVMNKTAKIMTELGENPSLQENDLKSISTKTTICVGSKDQMVTIEESEKAADLLVNGELNIHENFEYSIEKVDLNILTKNIYH